MRKMGFGVKWIKWVMKCVFIAYISVLVNGFSTKPIKLQKGLRQGYPLSPFLFNIVVKIFSNMLYWAKRKNNYSGILVSGGGPSLTHLQFANDTLLFFSIKAGRSFRFKKNSMLFSIGVWFKD